MARIEPSHELPPRDSRPLRIADVVVTIVLLVIAAGAALIGSALAVTFFFIGDSCNIPGGTVCDSGALTLGTLVSFVGPWLPVVTAGAIGIVRMVRRRSSWWVALLGLFAAAGIWVLGAAVALASNPSFTL